MVYRYWGFRTVGLTFWGPYDKDYNIWVQNWVPLFGKLPQSGIALHSPTLGSPIAEPLTGSSQKRHMDMDLRYPYVLHHFRVRGSGPSNCHVSLPALLNASENLWCGVHHLAASPAAPAASASKQRRCRPTSTSRGIRNRNRRGGAARGAREGRGE